VSIQWNFQEHTENVYKLLRDLSLDLLLWKRFTDAPLAIATDYGLSFPEAIFPKNVRVKRRPSSLLFSSGLNWNRFEKKYRKPAPVFFQSLSHAEQGEILLTLKGIKPAARIMVGEDRLGAAIHFLQEKNIPFVLSPFKVSVVSDPKKRDWSNLAGRYHHFNAEGRGGFMVYLASDGVRAQAVLLLEVLKADYELGLVLGYPECCVEFFEANFGKTQDTRGDLVSFSLRNTLQPPPYPFYINNLARYFGAQLIYHFPCRYTCQEAIVLGKQYLDLLQKEMPEWAKNCRKLLMCPVVYTDSQGVFLLEESCSRSDGSLSYNPDRIRATDETTPLFRLLRAADGLNVPNWPDGRMTLTKGDETVGRINSNAWSVTFS